MRFEVRTMASDTQPVMPHLMRHPQCGNKRGYTQKGSRSTNPASKESAYAWGMGEKHLPHAVSENLEKTKIGQFMRHYNKSLSHKNALLIFKCLFATILLMGKLNLQAQKTLKYEYEYDATGNRIACAVINVFDRNNIAETDKITENVFVDKDDMLIYPNPTKGMLKIESRNGEEIASCTIFDSNGRLLDKFFINSSSATIELSAYPRGFYIVNLEKKDKTINYKIIKE